MPRMQAPISVAMGIVGLLPATSASSFSSKPHPRVTISGTPAWMMESTRRSCSSATATPMRLTASLYCCWVSSVTWSEVITMVTPSGAIR